MWQQQTIPFNSAAGLVTSFASMYHKTSAIESHVAQFWCDRPWNMFHFWPNEIIVKRMGAIKLWLPKILTDFLRVREIVSSDFSFRIFQNFYQSSLSEKMMKNIKQTFFVSEKCIIKQLFNRRFPRKYLSVRNLRSMDICWWINRIYANV